MSQEPRDQRPDDKPKINGDDPMAYPISVLWAERQRVEHKIKELKAKQNKPLNVRYMRRGAVLDQPIGVLRDFDETRQCIFALQAKVARLGEAIGRLEGVS
jgi:hypothetical protein